jgi:Fe-S-cluster containining protein
VTGEAPAINPAVWYAQGLRFECVQCARCCSGAPGYVWLTVDDMHRMAGHLKMPFDDFTRLYVRQIGERYSLVEKSNYDCIFLTRDGAEGGRKTGCGVYDVRPMQCRTWPFWNENLASPEAWRRGMGKCPGMRNTEGPRYDLAHIEKCRQHVESPA